MNAHTIIYRCYACDETFSWIDDGSIVRCPLCHEIGQSFPDYVASISSLSFISSIASIASLASISSLSFIDSVVSGRDAGQTSDSVVSGRDAGQTATILGTRERSVPAEQVWITGLGWIDRNSVECIECGDQGRIITKWADDGDAENGPSLYPTEFRFCSCSAGQRAWQEATDEEERYAAFLLSIGASDDSVVSYDRE